ncbi:MAG: peptidoglycan DD-metalloendopeptidase family protein, partial [Anaerolineae bacterium]|nr:peptidoglycan DD-metalloendopeptidase family protein [Anaerolineae bacterium]
MVQRGSIAWFKRMARLVTAIACLLAVLIFPAKNAFAQTAFLSTPYYGRETQTQGFRPPDNPAHEGVDWALNYESVLAAADGSVYRARWQNLNDHASGYGLYVSINHTRAYSSYQTRYAHLSVITVSEGQQGIQRGQVVGTSGNTGHVDPPAPLGKHLHFEVRQNGVAVNPDPLWSDGEQVGRPFPRPRYGPDSVIVDDLDSYPQFSKDCEEYPCSYWYGTSSYGYQGHMFYTFAWNGPEDYWARWRPTIPAKGYYEVYVYVPSQHATSWQTPYTIHYSGGEQTVKVDQVGLRSSHADQWTSLGTYLFDAGTSGYIRAVNATGEAIEAGRKVGVDAIRLRRLAPTHLPDVRNNAGFVSHLFIRNDGAQQRNVYVYWFNSSGSPANPNHPSDACVLNSGQQCWIDVSDFQRIPSGGQGSAVADGGEHISVAVRTLSSSQSLAYSGMPESSALGFQASNYLLLPVYFNNF